MPHSTDHEVLLRLPAVLERFPVSKSTWWAGVKYGVFPAGVKLGARCTAWRESEINELIENLERVAREGFPEDGDDE
ncbi:AlpA family phage regulatory protein [uncultured Pseudodesulfovibrio sp.]|uniref:helix-turn-helix transcriptional regulator n=1 Tax=uncultured Pseudodesulfovibrio sp. TaxID=2035858 RepID=UPI0029C7AF10|nr:AlpA family phage regulatory protein [uncultured Pseudodesulfovibrio sp.]